MIKNYTSEVTASKSIGRIGVHALGGQIMRARKEIEIISYIHREPRCRAIDIMEAFKISRATFFRFIKLAWDDFTVSIVFEKKGYIVESYGVIDKTKL